jgi:hypothetical protein
MELTEIHFGSTFSRRIENLELNKVVENRTINELLLRIEKLERKREFKINNENKSKIKKIKKRTIELLEESSANGLPNIFRARNMIISIMWLIFTILSAFAGSYFVIDSIIDFLKYNTLTTLHQISEQKSQFPTISICGSPSFNVSIDQLFLRVRFDRIDDTNFSRLFEEFNDNIFGKCYRFNSGRNIYNETYDILNATTRGKPNNLKITFNLDVPEGYDFKEIVIYIHNHSSPPYEMDNGGYWLNIGSWNYYEMEREFYSVLGEPYNDCLKDVSSFKFNKSLIDFISNSKRIYTQEYCYLKSDCKCNSSLSNFDKDCLKNYFETFESETKECVSEYLKKFRKKDQIEKCSEYCPLECESINYKINNYFETTPDSGNISLRTKSNYYFHNFSTYDQLNKHFVVLYVYYKNLGYKMIRENPKTEMFNFISNIGGILGLFLGISFLSFIEIFEIIYEVIIILIFNN